MQHIKNSNMENTWAWWHTRVLVLKKIFSFHDRLTTRMNKCIQKTEIPEWMIKGKTALIKKDPPPHKVTAPNNYRPIRCVPMMWKILTTQILSRSKIIIIIIIIIIIMIIIRLEYSKTVLETWGDFLSLKLLWKPSANAGLKNSQKSKIVIMMIGPW